MTFRQGIEGYRRTMLRRAEEIARRAADGEVSLQQYFVAAYRLPVPEDHTKDYDAVIDMLDMTQEDDITLSYRDFTQYVRDEWDWKEQFMATSEAYLVS